jgi:hypothetical protein
MYLRSKRKKRSLWRRAIVPLALLLAIAAAAVSHYLPRVERYRERLIQEGWLSPQDASSALLPFLFKKPAAPRPPYEFTEQEKALLVEARRRIPAVRQGETQLILEDDVGNPLGENWQVDYRLINRHFLMGMIDPPHAFIDRARYALGTNLAATYGVWYEIDPASAPGYDMRCPEQLGASEWRRAAGYKLHFHTVAWNIYVKKDGGHVEIRIPEYVFKEIDDPLRRKEVFMDHIRAMAEYTRGRYDSVNLWNEPVNFWANAFGWRTAEILDHLKEASLEFRRINPSSEILINIGECLTGEELMSWYDLCRWMVEQEVECDWIGLQLWYNGFFPWGQAMKPASLERIYDGLKRYGQYSLPLYITEFAVPSQGEPYPGWQWDEERQAEFAEAVFTVAYSMPSVGGMNYSNSIDAFMRDGGLFDPEGHPRPVLNRLESLIDSWTTRGSGVTDSRGGVSVVGFGGDYILTAADPVSGRRFFYRFQIAERQKDRQTIQPQSEPDWAPEPYARLGPEVTRNLILPCSFESIPLERFGQEALPGLPVPLKGLLVTYQLEHPDEETWQVGEPYGFCMTDLPASDGDFQCDLKIDSFRGPIMYLQVITGDRRFLVETVPEGCYRLAFPVRAGEKPVVFTHWRNQEARVIVKNPRFRSAAGLLLPAEAEASQGSGEVGIE